MRASIIICTYNRASSLSRTLQTLADQVGVGFDDLEVLVVDNNSDDDTEVVVQAFKEHLPIRYCFEGTQGLSHARNRGISESLGDTLICTDDDVVLDRSWLASYLQAIVAFPEAGFFGGRILPDWESLPKPRWLRDERLDLLSGVLLAFDFGWETRPYRKGDEGPIGASFGVRRRLFDEIGSFRTDLGVIGSSRGRGEETEFFRRAKVHGAQGVYVGEALCWHRVDPERLKLAALYHYGIASGQAHKAITGDSTKGSVVKAIDYLLRGLYQLTKRRGDRFRQCIINVGIQMGTR